jgi:hypothetical protein
LPLLFFSFISLFPLFFINSPFFIKIVLNFSFPSSPNVLFPPPLALCCCSYLSVDCIVPSDSQSTLITEVLD